MVLDPICYNFIGARKLAACVSSAVRPRLAGVVREPEVIPVDVRIHAGFDGLLVPAKAIPSSRPTRDPRPIGTLLDCYM